MALTPGGGRSPSAQPPPKATPPSPPRRTRDQLPAPPMPMNVALRIVLRWVLLLGGVIIIVDLGTHAILQRIVDTPEALAEMGNANTIANVVLFSILGAVVARQTGMFYLGALAGLLAALLDGVVVATASTMAPPPGEQAPVDVYLLYNVLIGTIPASVSALVSTLAERMFGPRSR